MLTLSILSILLFCLVFFFGTELLKKFRFLQQFEKDSKDRSIQFTYTGTSLVSNGMQNMVLRSDKPFSVLIGFDLEIPLFNYSGYDCFGFAKSDENGVLVIQAYLGKKPAQFRFISTTLSESAIQVTSSQEDQSLTPHVSFLPHWYQRLGFFG